MSRLLNQNTIQKGHLYIVNKAFKVHLPVSPRINQVYESSNKEPNRQKEFQDSNHHHSILNSPSLTLIGFYAHF